MYDEIPQVRPAGDQPGRRPEIQALNLAEAADRGAGLVWAAGELRPTTAIGAETTEIG